ncbi:unnamed protein product [Rotaria sp. Silwood1]|nr:unnamed protein product [Rotaria sp. Silwood1]CAF1667357.1 unnamed protein product [Rotaria sp. Silwood1]
MEHEAVQLLDLPDEILLIIMKKLCSIDVLYSLLEVNKRLDKMARSLTHTKSLDFSSISSDHQFLSVHYPIINRFCNHILPQIHQNLEVLIVDQRWMEDILLTGQYSNIRMISIINCSPYTVYKYLAGM